MNYFLTIFRQILWCLALLTFPVFFVSLTWAAETKQEPEKFLLRYRFQKGDVLRWNVQYTLEHTTAMRGKTDVDRASSRSTKLWTVIDVSPDGTAVFEYKVADVNMRQEKNSQNEIRYNSKTDKEIPIRFGTLEGTIDVPLAEMTINTRGEMLKKVRKADYAGAYEDNRIAVPLPEKPVAVGDTWDIDIPIELKKPNGTVEKITGKQKLTLKSVQTGLATITFETEIWTPVGPETEAKIIDKFTKGELKLDLDTGKTVSQETSVNKTVIGFAGPSDQIQYQARWTECCCGRKACNTCKE